MSDWIDRLVSTRTTRATELAAQFAEERQRVLAANVANLDTPDYHSRTLDAGAFAATLRKALDKAGPSEPAALELRGDAQVSTGPDGRLRVRPGRSPAPNILFHDGTNARLEQLMSDATANSLDYSLATSLLRNRFDTLLNAIRGRIA